MTSMKKNKKCKDCDKIIWNVSIRCKSCNRSFCNKKNSQKISLRMKGNTFFKGKKHKLESMEILSEKRKGTLNPIWKGDKVGYGALHSWIKRNKHKSKLCENCRINKSFDLANISGEYKRDINDYKWICRSCHMKEDGRINNLKQGIKSYAN
jgi:hypothetical protein